MSQSYDDKSYDREALGDYISEDNYRYVITAVNLTIQQFWPCDLALNLGYFFAIFSFGLSLMLPNLCIKDAKINLLQTIVRMNALKLEERGLVLRYRSGLFTSWLELEILNPVADIEEAKEQEPIEQP